MKKSLLILSFICLAIISRAQDYIYTYPILYQNSADLLVKSKTPSTTLYASLDNTDSKRAFSNGEILFENLNEEIDYNLYLYDYDGSEYHKIMEEPILIKMKDREQIELDKELWGNLTGWSITENQEQKLSDLLKSLKNAENINPLEIISFAQQHRGYENIIYKDWSFEEKIDEIFQTKGIESPCHCSFVLNHWASAAPLKPNAGTPWHDGYNYLPNNQSQMIPDYNDYNTTTPKFHRWYTNEKGPAHDMFLYTYDSGNDFNYEWSTFGYDNTGLFSPSPNSAELSYQFFCEGSYNELPKDCQCTKHVLIAYNYDTYYKVIADKLKPLAKAHSAVEEVAVISTLKVKFNNPELEIKDAGRIRVQSYCRGTFNFTWLRNLGKLIGEILDTVSQIYAAVTNGSGNTANDILEILTTEIPEDIEALTGLLEVATINVTGDCTDKYGEASLLKGAFFLQMKSNEPTIVTLNSYTFLGVYGSKKWNDYAITRSDFRLQGIVLPGSVEESEFCCSDKLGNHLYATMDGPVNENDLHDWTQSIYALFAPWDNFTTTGYQPAFPINANRGYFIHENKEMDCASTEAFGKTGSEIASIYNIEEEETEINLPTIDKYSINNVVVNLYPNPSNAIINIEVENINANEKVDISVYDAQGKIITNIFDNQTETDNIQTTLDLSSLGINCGTYFVFISQNGIVKTAKPFIYTK